MPAGPGAFGGCTGRAVSSSHDLIPDMIVIRDTADRLALSRLQLQTRLRLL